MHKRDPDALAQLLTAAAAARINRSPSLEAHTKLHEARLAALRGEDDPCFGDAVAALRDVGEPFWVATALLEQAEWLAAHGRSEEIVPLATEARDVFDRLRARPRLDRLDAIQAVSSTSVPASA